MLHSVSPVFRCSSASVYYTECNPQGRPGNEASILTQVGQWNIVCQHKWLLVVCENNEVLYFRTLHLMHLHSGSPAKSLFSFLPFLQENKGKPKTKPTTGTNHKKFSERKQAHVEMESSKTNQTRWEWHHNTFTPSLHPFCQLCTPRNSLHTY